MHLAPHHLLLLGYLDSLFVESRVRTVDPPREVPATLNRLFAGAMRAHDRDAVLLHRDAGAWQPTPDWRFDRHVIRLALYLRERLGVGAGDRIALLSELRPAWLLADLAALALGAVSVALDPRLRGEALATALEEAQPAATLVSPAGHAALARLDGRAPAFGRLVAFAPADAADGIASLDACLELGGTLDTPERAQTIRATARELGPDAPALRHYVARPGGWNRLDLTQGQVVAKLRVGPLAHRGKPGDVALVLDPAVSPAARLATYAFIGDGYTTTALAPARTAAVELDGLCPAVVVLPAESVAELVRAAEAHSGLRRWLGRGRAVRDLLGGTVRRIDTTGPLDPALATRLRAGLTVAQIPT